MSSCYDCIYFSWSDGSPYCDKYFDYVGEDYARGNNCSDFSKKQYSSSSSSGSSSSGGCFLTSACVGHLGKADDCTELTTLRRFRDTYMKGTEERNALVTEYYAVAPKIVECIDASADKDAIYDDIYGVITDCIGLINGGDNAAAQQRYVNMVNGLKTRFGF